MTHYLPRVGKTTSQNLMSKNLATEKQRVNSDANKEEKMNLSWGLFQGQLQFTSYMYFLKLHSLR